MCTSGCEEAAYLVRSITEETHRQSEVSSATLYSGIEYRPTLRLTFIVINNTLSGAKMFGYENRLTTLWS